MKKKAENFTAAVFLAVLGICLVLVLTGVVRVGTGQQEPVGLSYYDPGPEGPTYVSLVKWFENTCRAFCTTELPGRMVLQEANAHLNRSLGKWIFESTDPEVVRLHNGYLESIGNFYYYLTEPDITVADFAAWTEETLGCPFLYVQAPCKLCQIDNELPLPEMTNNNAEASWLLRMLEERGVAGPAGEPPRRQPGPL